MIIEHGLSYCLRLPIERVTILLSLFQYTLGTFLQEKKQRRIMKKMRILLQRRFIFAPPVNWKSSSINSQHVHFSLYSLPGQGRFFFSMDKEVTHAKNRRRGLWIDCVVVFVREVAAAVYYNGSLAKFFLEMLWEKSLLGYYTSNTSHQRDENDIFYDKSWSLAYHAFHFTFCCLPGSS